MTTTIKFDTKMHRTVCLCGPTITDTDVAAYDANIEAYWTHLRSQLADGGYELDLDWQSHGPSYTVSADGRDAEVAAQTFMQFDTANFWEWLN